MSIKIGVVLLSGGLDSTTTATFAKRQGYKIHALSVTYGQKLSREILSAKKVSQVLGIEHKIVDMSSYKDIAWYSALTRPELFDVPKGRKLEEMTVGIPITYVPMRNTFLIVLASAYLESILLSEIEKDQIPPSDIEARIFIAANAMDYSGYPDCRPEYYDKMNELIKSASKVGVQYNIQMMIETPLLYKTKKDIVEMAIKLGAPLEWTWSCYEGGEVPCQKCDSCLLRAKGFKENGIEDPLILRLRRENRL